MFCAVAENMINAGGPMGGPNTTEMWRKYFKSIGKAKKYCEKHYYKIAEESAEKLEWFYNEKNRASTRDLGWVMYEIFKVKTED